LCESEEINCSEPFILIVSLVSSRAQEAYLTGTTPDKKSHILMALFLSV
jgi:hypothetical protein